MLSDVEELSYAEIAKLFSCPLGTVRSRLHRGRKMLREQLSGFAALNGYITNKITTRGSVQEESLKESFRP
jgi:RNA polymerase sigma-70 factor (ECF subfamily)